MSRLLSMLALLGIFAGCVVLWISLGPVIFLGGLAVLVVVPIVYVIVMAWIASVVA